MTYNNAIENNYISTCQSHWEGISARLIDEEVLGLIIGRKVPGYLKMSLEIVISLLISAIYVIGIIMLPYCEALQWSGSYHPSLRQKSVVCSFTRDKNESLIYKDVLVLRWVFWNVHWLNSHLVSLIPLVARSFIASTHKVTTCVTSTILKLSESFWGISVAIKIGCKIA